MADEFESSQWNSLISSMRSAAVWKTSEADLMRLPDEDFNGES